MGEQPATARRRPHRRPLSNHNMALVVLIGAGLVLLVLGAVWDIGHHTGMPVLGAENVGAAGHMVTLAGMVLTAGGVVLDAALRRR